MPKAAERIWAGEVVLDEGTAPARIEIWKPRTLPQAKTLLRTAATRIPHLSGADFQKVRDDKYPHIILDDAGKLLGVIAFNEAYPCLRLPYFQQEKMGYALLHAFSTVPELADRYYGLFENQLCWFFDGLDRAHAYCTLSPEQLADRSIEGVKPLLAGLERLMAIVQGSPSWATRLRQFNLAVILFCELVCDTYTVGPSKKLAENRAIRRNLPVGELDIRRQCAHGVFVCLLQDEQCTTEVGQQARHVLFDYFPGHSEDIRAISGYQAFVRDIDSANPELALDAKVVDGLTHWQGAAESILLARFNPDRDTFVKGMKGAEVAAYIRQMMGLHDDAKIAAVVAVAHYARDAHEAWTAEDRQTFSRSFILLGVILPDTQMPPLDLKRENIPKEPPPLRSRPPARRKGPARRRTRNPGGQQQG